MDTSYFPPDNTKRKSLLVGVIVDVSSSMQKNWRNRHGRKVLRIEVVRDALNTQVHKIAAQRKNKASRTVGIFCLGMGFKRPMYWSDVEISYGYEGEPDTEKKQRTQVDVVCDILALSEIVPTKAELRRLETTINRKWNDYARRILSRITIGDDVYEELRCFIRSALKQSAHERLTKRLPYRLHARLKDIYLLQRYQFTRRALERLSRYVSSWPEKIEQHSLHASIRYFNDIVDKANEIFEGNKEIYTGYIRGTLDKFVCVQTRRLLSLLTLGYPHRVIFNSFDEEKARELAWQIYDHLDDEVRGSIGVAWSFSKGHLGLAARGIGASLDMGRVKQLTEACIRKCGWAMLQPFVTETVTDLFVESFRLEAKKEMPYWIGLASSREITRSLKQIANVLPDALEQDIYSDEFMFGSTPIDEAMNRASVRFLDRANERREKVLVIISDGEFKTDAPHHLAYLLRETGVTIICCCVVDRNIMTRLVRRASKRWPEGAKTLFDMASTADGQNPLISSMKQNGLEVSEGVKLFYQLNQSEQLEEILQSILVG